MTEFSRARRRTANYKSCFFRNCGNTTICASEKIFIPVPKGEVRKQWIKIVRGDDTREFSLKSSLYCCEDHFDVRIMLKHVGLQQIRLPRKGRWRGSDLARLKRRGAGRQG